VSEIPLFFDDFRREAVGEEVAERKVASVERLGVAAVQTLDATGELDRRRLEDDVIVRGHEAERMNDPAAAVDGVTQM